MGKVNGPVEIYKEIRAERDALRAEVEVWKQGHQVHCGTIEVLKSDRAKLISAMNDLLEDGASIAERNHARALLAKLFCEG